MGFGYAVYFTERDKNRVLRWDPDSGDVDVVAGEPADGDPVQKLGSPYGLAFSKSGELLIADKLNHRICRLVNGKLVAIPFSDPQGSRSRRPDSPPGDHSVPHCPTGIFVEESGSLLCTFSDDYTIYRIHPDGRLEHLLGIPPTRHYIFSEVVSKAAAPRLKDVPVNVPTGIVKGKDGTIYFIERMPQLVRGFHPGRGLWSVFGGEAQDETERRPAPERASVRTYRPPYPASLAIGAQGDLFVADACHASVFRIDTKSGVVERVLQVHDSPSHPDGGVGAVAFGEDGVAWVFNCIRRSVEAYLVPEVGPWVKLKTQLDTFQNRPLELPLAGSGLALGR